MSQPTDVATHRHRIRSPLPAMLRAPDLRPGGAALRRDGDGDPAAHEAAVGHDGTRPLTDDGEVRLSVRTDPDKVEITVSDTGTGIPAGQLERVFEEFYCRISRAAR